VNLDESDLKHLRAAIEIAARSRAHGNHPFGARLTDSQGNVLLEAENTVVTERDCTGHAETNLMRLASAKYDPAILAECTLYTSTEPCVMCAGAIYWGGVGRVVYALSEEYLYQLTGAHPENPTLKLPCRQVFSHTQREVRVEGPAIEQEARQVHEGFWN
jgi:tRNA(Arg) A34 adenosine deaminase TadA